MHIMHIICIAFLHTLPTCIKYLVLIWSQEDGNDHIPACEVPIQHRLSIVSTGRRELGIMIRLVPSTDCFPGNRRMGSPIYWLPITCMMIPIPFPYKPKEVGSVELGSCHTCLLAWFLYLSLISPLRWDRWNLVSCCKSLLSLLVWILYLPKEDWWNLGSWSLFVFVHTYP